MTTLQLRAAAAISPIAEVLARFEFPVVRFEFHRIGADPEQEEALFIEVQEVTFEEAWDHGKDEPKMELLPQKYRNYSLPFDEMGNFRRNPEDDDSQDPRWGVIIDWNGENCPPNVEDLGYMNDVEVCLEDLLRTELKGFEFGGKFAFHGPENVERDIEEGENPPLRVFSLSLHWEN